MGKSRPSPAILAGTAPVTSVYSSHFFSTVHSDAFSKLHLSLLSPVGRDTHFLHEDNNANR